MQAATSGLMYRAAAVCMKATALPGNHVKKSNGGCRAAAEVVAMADEQLPYSNSPALQAARLGLAHERALHRGDIRHVALFASQLGGLADPTDSVNRTLR